MQSSAYYTKPILNIINKIFYPCTNYSKELIIGLKYIFYYIINYIFKLTYGNKIFSHIKHRKYSEMFKNEYHSTAVRKSFGEREMAC